MGLTKEDVLQDYGLLRKLAEDGARGGQSLLFYTGPREVDVEQEEQDAQPDDGRLCIVSLQLSSS